MPDVERPTSIYFLIRSLALGGAQRQLVQLAHGLAERGQRVSVAIFYSGGPLVADLERAGIRVIHLRKRGRWDTLGFLWRLRRSIAQSRPDVVYSFDGGSNVFSALARPFVRRTRFIWGVRASDMDLAHYGLAHRVGYAAECRLSRSADLIISNSEAGRQFAADHGFPREKIAVVPNGIDTARFRPDPKVRRTQRAAWGLRDDEVAIGMLARLDPMKGHVHFLRAAAQVRSTRNDVKFVCVGDGRDEARLKAITADLGMEDAVLFPGPTNDPVAALNGFDLFCSASVFGEGFSNAVGEAMACGLPCIVTDVGDSAMIVGDRGTVVKPADPEALARAMSEWLDDRRDKAGRQRVVEHFSIPAMIDRTLDLISS